MKVPKKLLKKSPVPVQVTFFDHSFHDQHHGLDSVHPILAEVYGLLVKETESCYYIASWVSDNDPASSQAEYYVIIKSTVIDARVLK